MSNLTCCRCSLDEPDGRYSEITLRSPNRASIQRPSRRNRASPDPRSSSGSVPRRCRHRCSPSFRPDGSSNGNSGPECTVVELVDLGLYSCRQTTSASLAPQPGVETLARRGPDAVQIETDDAHAPHIGKAGGSLSSAALCAQCRPSPRQGEQMQDYQRFSRFRPRLGCALWSLHAEVRSHQPVFFNAGLFNTGAAWPPGSAPLRPDDRQCRASASMCSTDRPTRASRWLQ